jgi:hypothetical protein
VTKVLDVATLGMLFWSMEAAYCIHCLGETVAGTAMTVLMVGYLFVRARRDRRRAAGDPAATTPFG